MKITLTGGTKSGTGQFKISKAIFNEIEFFPDFYKSGGMRLTSRANYNSDFILDKEHVLALRDYLDSCLLNWDENKRQIEIQTLKYKIFKSFSKVHKNLINGK